MHVYSMSGLVKTPPVLTLSRSRAPLAVGALMPDGYTIGLAPVLCLSEQEAPEASPVMWPAHRDGLFLAPAREQDGQHNERCCNCRYCDDRLEHEQDRVACLPALQPYLHRCPEAGHHQQAQQQPH
jgi:hypothetical protein